MRTYKKIAFTFLLLLSSVFAMSQFADADPTVIDITKQGPLDPVPLGTNISGNAILKFRVGNASAFPAGTGAIPPNSLNYTVQFNPFYTYQSLVPTAQFAVTFASPGAPLHVVTLTNLVTINPGDVLDFYINVIATQITVDPAGEPITINVDRTIPISVGNTQTGNDNVAKRFTVSLVLPSKLLTLSAVLNNNQVDLKWTTTDEIDLSSFDLERSTDGINFSVITNKAAAGNTTGETNYTYRDNIQQLISGVVYYRVKSKDINGQFHYSRIRTVKPGKGVTVYAYPNPFTELLNLQITSPSNTKGLVRLYNSIGITVKSREVALSTGVNVISFEGLKMLSQGSYVIEITIGGEKIFSGKLVK